MEYLFYLCYVNQLNQKNMFTEKFRNVLALILFALQLASLVNFFLSDNENELIFSLFSFLIFGALGTFCLILNAKPMEDNI